MTRTTAETLEHEFTEAFDTDLTNGLVPLLIGAGVPKDMARGLAWLLAGHAIKRFRTHLADPATAERAAKAAAAKINDDGIGEIAVRDFARVVLASVFEANHD